MLGLHPGEVGAAEAEKLSCLLFAAFDIEFPLQRQCVPVFEQLTLLVTIGNAVMVLVLFFAVDYDIMVQAGRDDVDQTEVGALDDLDEWLASELR